jgi:hypothetical protein
VFKYGFDVNAFVPGPFTISALQGGVFLANELNRGDEYVLNSCWTRSRSGSSISRRSVSGTRWTTRSI